MRGFDVCWYVGRGFQPRPSGGPERAAPPQRAPPRRSRRYVPALMANAAGIVSTHAQTICPATPHRTAESRLVDPTPTIEPVIACVVLTPTPRYVAVKTAMAAPVSAANPLTGCSLVIFDPIV